MTSLDQYLKILDGNGFDTSVAGGILAASKESPDYSVEITIDSGGGCLVKKTEKQNDSPRKISIAGQKISVIYQNFKSWQFRVKLSSTENLIEILKFVDSSPRL